MKVEYHQTLDESVRRDIEHLADSSLQATPHQLPVFSDWWADVNPALTTYGFFLGRSERELTYSGFSYAYQDSDGATVIEFPRGPLALTEDALLEGVAQTLRLLPARTRVVIAPRWPEAAALEAALVDLGLRPMRRHYEEATVLVDLSPSLDAVWKRMSSATRHHVRHSERRGVIVRESHDDADIAWFCERDRHLSKTRGTDVLPEQVLRRALKPTRAARLHLFIAETDSGGRMGEVLYSTARRVQLYKNVSDDGVRDSQLLKWRCIAWAHAAGAEVVDLGGADLSPRGAGVLKHKLGFAPDGFVRLLPAFVRPPASGK